MKAKHSSLLTNVISLLTLSLLGGCNYLERIEQKAGYINQYEVKALNLAKKNRELEIKVSQLEYEVESLKSKNNYLSIQLEKSGKKAGARRGIASVAVLDASNNLVKQNIYNWTPNQLLSIGQKEFDKQNYKKSAQFFHTYLQYEKKHKTVDDKILFQAGLAAYESQQYLGWSVKTFDNLIKRFPASEFYRSAKLWRSLAHLKQGNHGEFYKTVEEFRKKYRNTPEWKIISGHYNEINKKYKKHD